MESRRVEKPAFPDEPRFEILNSNAQHAYRRSGETFHEPCVIQPVKHPKRKNNGLGCDCVKALPFAYGIVKK